MHTEDMMIPEFDNSNIEMRVDEIKTLITNNILNQATKRLMDLTTEFTTDKKLKNESIVLRQKFIELNSDKRKFGYTQEINVRQTELAHNILELTDIVEDIFNKKEITETIDIKTEVPGQKASNNTEFHQIESYENKDDASLTRSEIRKKAFKEEKNLKDGENAEIACSAERLEKQYPNNKNFRLSNVSLEMKLREITGVVGENGNGKTTLLKIIGGELALDNGKLSFPLLCKGELDWYKVKQQMAYIPQQLSAWNGSLKDNLYFSASIHGIKGKKNKEEVEYMIYRLGLEEYLNLKWNEISGGYKTRFELARMLIWKPKLLVLDEPLANLDINAQIIFLQDLKDLANSIKDPISIIISSQHLHEIECIANKIMFLEDGKIKFYGETKNLGKERMINSFEVAGSHSGKKLTRDTLYNMLSNMDIKDIEDIDLSLVIHTPINIHAEDLLKMLLKHPNIELTYFRNISTSTRTLFRRKY